MSWQEDAVTRLDSLIAYGGENIDYGTNRGQAHFIGWRTQATEALRAVIGEDNIYTKQFMAYAKYENGPDSGLEIGDYPLDDRMPDRYIRGIGDTDAPQPQQSPSLFSPRVFRAVSD